MSDDILDILGTYAEEYSRDTVLDDLRLREIELKIPGVKGKWASYKAINQAKLYKLKLERDRLLDEGIGMIIKKRENEGNPVSAKGAEYILRNTDRFKELTNKIDRLSILCGYFDDCLKTIQGIGFDIKNLIDTIKLDELG